MIRENKIRIYVIIPVRDGLKNHGDKYWELLAPVRRPGAEITLADLPTSPLVEILNSYHKGITGPIQVQAAIEAEKQGYDAVCMGCMTAPGYTAGKEVLEIPVVNPIEAVMHYGSMVGRRFSFVFPGDIDGRALGRSYDGRIMEDLARQYGFREKLASVRMVAAANLDFFTGDDNLADSILKQAKFAVDEDGADSIVAYGGPNIVRRLKENLEVPVIVPVQASVMMAESLVRMGIAQSKRAFKKP